jgi:hypothetical protein
LRERWAGDGTTILLLSPKDFRFRASDERD